MITLLVTRGLPASGKTTFARQWVAENMANRVRINRDDLRMMIYDGDYVPGVTESQIINARDFLILAMLRGGKNVICDDTNLPPRTMRGLHKLAMKVNATLKIHDLTNVSLEECLTRNAVRTDKPPVPEMAIRNMYAQYLAVSLR